MNRLVPLLLAALVLAACGGAESAADAGESVEGTGQVATAEDDRTQGATPTTLEEYLGAGATFVRSGGGAGGRLGGRGGGAAGFDDERALEEQRLVQIEIQKCMQAQGFTYVPEEVGDGLRFFLASQQSALSPADYAKAEGFGISTRFDAVLEGEFDLSEAVEPNEDHLATLSNGEADAWRLALRGAEPVRNDQGQLVDPDTGEVLQGQGQGRAQGGCTADAQVAVRGDFSTLDELADEFAELDDRIAADPRVTEIARTWVDCMRIEGFDYQTEAEARQFFNGEFRPLLRSFFQSGNQEGQVGRGGNNALQAITGLELTAEQELELQALQDLERSTAVASITCQGDAAEELAAITADYEAEFVDANRDALEAFAG